MQWMSGHSADLLIFLSQIHTKKNVTFIAKKHENQDWLIKNKTNKLFIMINCPSSYIGRLHLAVVDRHYPPATTHPHIAHPDNTHPGITHLEHYPPVPINLE